MKIVLSWFSSIYLTDRFLNAGENRILVIWCVAFLVLIITETVDYYANECWNVWRKRNDKANTVRIGYRYRIADFCENCKGDR